MSLAKVDELNKDANNLRMPSLSFRHLLTDHRGNVNKRNRANQTALHCLLQPGNEVRRNECLNLFLKWKDKHSNETIDLDAKDSVRSFSIASLLSLSSCNDNLHDGSVDSI